MRLRPGVDRKEAERRVARSLQENVPLTVDDLEDEDVDASPRSLLSLMFRPRVIRAESEEKNR